jgi:DNA-binding XRE family transcriptional regulator
MSDLLETPIRFQAPRFTLQDRMAKARETAGMSQLQMATLLGVSRRTVVRIEAQGAVVPPAVVLAYHVACRVDLAWLDSGLPSWEGGESSWYTAANRPADAVARPEGLEPPTF